MSAVEDHLRSPQFTDPDGDPTGTARVTFFVAPGRPRWLGYLFYLGGFVLGLVLALGLIDPGGTIGSDLIVIIGVVGMFGAVYGTWEIWHGSQPSLRAVVDRLRGREP